METLLDSVTNSTAIQENDKNMLMSMLLDGDLEAIVDFMRNITGLTNQTNHSHHNEKVIMEELVDEQKEYNKKYCNDVCEENDEMIYTFGISESSKIEKCSICLEDIPITFRLIRTSCDHIFCPGCFYRWYAKEPSCPCCRKKMHLQ